MRRMENKLEDIRTTAHRLESIIERLQAEGNKLQMDARFMELDSNTKELEDYISIHRDTIIEPTNYFHEMKQRFQNYSQSHQARQPTLRQPTLMFYNSASIQ